MGVGKGGDLRQVRHHQHLTVLGETLQEAADRAGRLATESGVYLVEDERRLLRPRNDVEREHHPRQLATRRDGGERCGRFAEVRAQQKRHLVAARGGVVG